MQVGAILSVMHALQSYLLYNASRDPEDHPELDGGAHAAAVTTFAKACDRMDKILEDDKRWTLTDHDALYASILKTQTDIQRLNEENVTTLQQMRLPHRKYHPQFAISGDMFLAFDGDPNFPGGQIIGKGRTPKEALEDFDRAFERGTKDQLRFSQRSQERIQEALAKQHAEETVQQVIEKAPEATEPAPPAQPESFWRKLLRRFKKHE